MFEFYHLKKTKIILATLNFIKYITWCSFFVFQGRAIQQAIDKNIIIDQLFLTLMWLILTKLIVMSSDLLSQFVISYFENIEADKQWRVFFPKKIYHDNETKNNLIYLMYFDHIPALFNIECSILNNQCTIISVTVIVISLLIYSGFYSGLLALLVIFILSFTSKSIFLKKLDDYHKEINENKTRILGWVNQFFKSYREISLNWYGQVNQWANSIYSSLYLSKKKLVYTQLRRDFLSQILVEIPFILNTSAVIIAVYFNYLSITQMFVWVGFSQFVITATNSFLDNKVNLDKKNLLVNQLTGIIDVFKVKEKIGDIQSESNALPPQYVQIKLRDNTVNYLSLNPSIYHIQGKNGSGKSTLLNIMTGYERYLEVDNHNDLLHMLHNISPANIRVIEREPEFFSLFLSFNEQILGPEQSKFSYWLTILNDKMTGILSKNTINDLKCFYLAVEEKFHQRLNGHFSSGEKILLSLLRALTSWNNQVFILIADECTAFLDFKSKYLFLCCLYELSNIIPIFISSHEMINLDKFEKSDVIHFY